MRLNEAQTAVTIINPDGRRAWVTMNPNNQAVALEWEVPQNRESEGRAAWLNPRLLTLASREIRGCI